MTFLVGSIGMTLLAVGWLAYHGLVKRDLREHQDELRTGAFVIAAWAIVWWLLFH